MGTIIRNGKKMDTPDGDHITKACEELGVLFACEDGQCGTCEIQVVKGMDNLTTKTSQEEMMNIQKNNRLACQCKLKKGTIDIKIVGDDVPKEYV